LEHLQEEHRQASFDPSWPDPWEACLQPDHLQEQVAWEPREPSLQDPSAYLHHQPFPEKVEREAEEAEEVAQRPFSEDAS